MKDQVKLILIGDDGVGKSSLMSSYISRHFPNEVPHVMTDAIIPPQTTSNDVTVTVMDSSSWQSDLDVLKQKIAIADSIIALYDVTRPDTFDNLAQVWFPLINNVHGENHNKPVIVVGTKIDLLLDDNDTDQLRSLLETSPFVLACLKCSALQLQDVEDIFHYGVDAVTYPLEPIFDIFTHEFKPACRRALLRIFRALDTDNDNLLSDAEMRETELRCFALQISDDELLSMKRQISSVEGGLSKNTNLVTFEGFLGLIAMIIEDTSFRIPWQILRRFDYDDDLDYLIPEEVTELPTLRPDQATELSPDARDFLLGLATTAHQESAHRPSPQENDSNDETASEGTCLTWDALKHILSVIPADIPHPWSQPPSFLCVWREDGEEQRRADRSLQQSILLSQLPHIGANMSFDAWLTQWHVLAANNPVLTQELLFRLGYIERMDFGLVVSSGPVERIARYAPPVRSVFDIWQKEDKPPAPRSTVCVSVLGGNCVGKSSLVWSLSGLTAPGSQDIEKGLGNEKPQDTVIVGGLRQERVANGDSASDSYQPPSSSRSTAQHATGRVNHLQSTYYLSLSAVPLEHATTASSSKKFTRSLPAAAESSFLDNCDLVLLMFQCGDMESFEMALQIERGLPDTMPRMFIASKSDLIRSKVALGSSTGSSGAVLSAAEKQKRDSLQTQQEVVHEVASRHVQEHGLPPLLTLSTLTGDGVSEVLSAITTLVADPSRGVPVQHRNRQVSTFSLSWPLALLGALSLAVVGAMWKQKELREYLDHISPTVRSWIHVMNPMNSAMSPFGAKG